MSYEVKETEFGVLVFGQIPIGDMVALSKVWEGRGLTEVAPGVASALGATLAVTGNVDAWIKAIDKDLSSKKLDPELLWLAGTDTGTSSKTIFSVLCRPEIKGRVDLRFNSVPYDNADFGRCYRLVVLMGWRDRLPEVAARYPEWEPIVREWNALAALHTAGLGREVRMRLRDLQEDLRRAQKATS